MNSSMYAATKERKRVQNALYSEFKHVSSGVAIINLIYEWVYWIYSLSHAEYSKEGPLLL